MDDKGTNCSADQRQAKGNAVENYRPITCLPIMWKVLTGIIAEDLYQDFHQGSLLTGEQKVPERLPKGEQRTNWL